MSVNIRKEKIVAKMILFLILISIFVVAIEETKSNAVATDTNVQINLGNVNGSTGCDVEVPIQFSNVSSSLGIANCDFTISYDKTKLSVVEVIPGDIIQNSNMNFCYYNVNDASSNEGQIQIMFIDESVTQNQYINNNGVFAKIKFHINSNLAIGSSLAVNFALGDGAFCLPGDEFISRDIISSNGSITISGLLKGDVNNDRTVDSADAIMILKADAGLLTLTNIQISAADVNNDGIVDAADAVKMLKYDAGLITTL